jgi:uncharacterized protein (TIGR03435 family)
MCANKLNSGRDAKTERGAAATIAGGTAFIFLALLSVMSAMSSRAESRAQNAAGTKADAGAKYEYDVVSIKISGSDVNGGASMNGYAEDGLAAHGVRMFWIFLNAFGMTKPEIVGAPAWFDDVRFTIDAKLDPATSAELKKLSPDQLKAARTEMLQAILEKRFGLKFHFETRELPAYFLTVANGGPKMQEAKPGDAGKSNLADINGVRRTDFVTIGCGGQNCNLMGQAASMTTLAEYLSQSALPLSGENAKPVVDKTGLTGKYDFAVKFSMPAALVAPSGANPAGGQPQAEMQNPGGPNLFKTLQDGLGLKMDAGKGPVRVIVIDHVEKPSAN